jgi:hypothetical protein
MHDSMTSQDSRPVRNCDVFLTERSAAKFVSLHTRPVMNEDVKG